MIWRSIFFLFIVVSPEALFSQATLFSDGKALKDVEQGLQLAYNSQFTEAEQIFKSIQTRFPKHPAGSVLLAQLIQLKYVPIENDKVNFALYKNYLKKGLELAEKILEANPKDMEGIYFSLAVHSQLARIFSEDGDYVKAAGAASSAYDQIKKGFELKEKFKEFYFSSGVYNYYRVQYPQDHPGYKPFLMFFADGDKQKGLKDLEQGGKESLFSSAESYFYLSNIYLRYENKPEAALKFTTILTNKYPNNSFFTTKHIEALLFTRQYDLVPVFLDKIQNLPSPFFKAATSIYQGMLYELHKKDSKEAKSFYLKGINIGNSVNKRANVVMSFAYAGLARISIQEGNRAKASEYYRKAEELTDYYSIKKEARNFLKK